MVDEDNSYLELPSLSGKNKKLVVMLHGVGSDGGDLISLAPFINSDFPDYYFFSPNGIESYDMAPFGYQWFSLKDRTPDVIIQQAKQNAPKIEKIISKKQKQLNLSNEDTILFGFSQGAMIASYLTLSQKEPYHAMLGFAGRLIIGNEEGINKKTPICLVHGECDEIVPHSFSKDFQKYCIDNSIKCELKLIPNLEHSIDHAGIEFAKNFLKNL